MITVLILILWIIVSCVVPGYCLISIFHTDNRYRSYVDNFALSLVYGITFLAILSSILWILHLFSILLLGFLILIFVLFTYYTKKKRHYIQTQAIVVKKIINFAKDIGLILILIIIFGIISYIILFKENIHFYGTDQYRWMATAKYIIYNTDASYPLLLTYPFRDLSYPSGFSFFMASFFLLENNISYLFIRFFSIFFIFCSILGIYVLASHITNKYIAVFAPLVLFSGDFINYYFFTANVVPQNLGYFYFSMLCIVCFNDNFISKHYMGVVFIGIGLYLIHVPTLFLFSIGIILMLLFLLIKKLFIKRKTAVKCTKFNYIKTYLSKKLKNSNILDNILLSLILIFLLSILIRTILHLIYVYIHYGSFSAPEIYYHNEILLSPQNKLNFHKYLKQFGSLIWYSSLIGILYPFYFYRNIKNKKQVIFIIVFFIFIYIISSYPEKWFLISGLGYKYFRYLNFASLSLSILFTCAIMLVIEGIKFFFKRYNTRIIPKIIALLLVAIIIGSLIPSVIQSSTKISSNMLETKLNNEYIFETSYWLSNNLDRNSKCLVLMDLDANAKIYVNGLLYPRSVFTDNVYDISDNFIQVLKNKSINCVVIDPYKYPKLNEVLSTSPFFNEIYNQTQEDYSKVTLATASKIKPWDDFESINGWKKKVSSIEPSTKHKQGNYSMKVSIKIDNTENWPGAIKIINNEDWTKYKAITFWIYTETTANRANFRLFFRDASSGGHYMPAKLLNKNDLNKWKFIIWDIRSSDRDNVILLKFIIYEIGHGFNAGDTVNFYIDDMKLIPYNPLKVIVYKSVN